MLIIHFPFTNEWQWKQSWMKPEINIVEKVDYCLSFETILFQMIIGNLDMKICIRNTISITYKITHSVLILQLSITGLGLK